MAAVDVRHRAERETRRTIAKHRGTNGMMNNGGSNSTGY
jgi:hypothetical protein